MEQKAKRQDTVAGGFIRHSVQVMERKILNKGGDAINNSAGV